MYRAPFVRPVALEREGIVALPHRGYFVIDLTDKELRNLACLLLEMALCNGYSR